MKMETKSLALKLDGPPDAEGRFTGYAAAFGNVDKGNDIIEPGAFTKTLQENPTVPILWSHDTNEPIGVSTSMVEDGKGLRFEGQLIMEVQRAREVHALMSAGAVKGVSIGYRVIKREFDGKGTRHLQELALGEFSPTVFPMNDQAIVTGVKYDPYTDDVAWYATQGISALIEMVGYGSRLMVGRMASGDADGAIRMQSVVGALAAELDTEISAVFTEDGESANTYVECMSEPVKLAIKKLEALLVVAEPSTDTPAAEDAATKNDDEPLLSTLAGLTRSFRAGR